MLVLQYLGNGKSIQKHNTGVYIQNIPIDPVTGYSSIDYKSAEEIGYTKIDFLNMSAYDGIRDENHLNEILERPVYWELFTNKEVVDNLIHIHDHFGVVSKYPPNSVEDLAMILALIRPGKKHLIGQSREIIMRDIWIKEDGAFNFKKSHAISYAMAIIVQLHLFCDKN